MVTCVCFFLPFSQLVGTPPRRPSQADAGAKLVSGGCACSSCRRSTCCGRHGTSRPRQDERAKQRVVVTGVVVHQARAVLLLPGVLVVGCGDAAAARRAECVVALAGLARALRGDYRAAQVVAVEVVYHISLPHGDIVTPTYSLQKKTVRGQLFPL